MTTLWASPLIDTVYRVGCTPCPRKRCLSACKQSQLSYDICLQALTRLLRRSGRRKSWEKLGTSGDAPPFRLGADLKPRPLVLAWATMPLPALIAADTLSLIPFCWPDVPAWPWPVPVFRDGLMPRAVAALAIPQPVLLPCRELPAWEKPGLAAILEKIILKSFVSTD